VITGFNTDIEHEGVTYHVQTEDKGLDSPLILSLVYSGGAILASKRSTYEDLIATGFSEKTLAERLQRQHKLICAAIRAGRIDELKLMTRREAVVRSTQKAERKEELRKAELPTIMPADSPRVARSEHPAASASEQPAPASQPEAKPRPAAVVPARPLPPPPPLKPLSLSQNPIVMRPAPASHFEVARRAETEADLNVELLDDRDFRAGDVVALRIRVSRAPGNDADSVANAPVTVKVLGTTFRPLICTAMTDRDGIAVVFTTLPRFKSGRAAILIRAVVGSQDAELRRIILPN
jgi:hypothetical protein